MCIGYMCCRSEWNVVLVATHFCGTVYAVKIFDIFRWNKIIPELGLLVLASCSAVVRY